MSSHFCLAARAGLCRRHHHLAYGFLRVPLSALVGWLLYHEQIDVFTPVAPP